jgi:hypothetical protein
MNQFIDNMAFYAVKAKVSFHLEKTFVPANVMSMPADAIKSLAGESEEAQAYREQVNKQLSTLFSGLDTCKRFAKRTVTQQPSGMCS